MRAVKIGSETAGWRPNRRPTARCNAKIIPAGILETGEDLAINFTYCRRIIHFFSLNMRQNDAPCWRAAADSLTKPSGYPVCTRWHGSCDSVNAAAVGAVSQRFSRLRQGDDTSCLLN